MGKSKLSASAKTVVERSCCRLATQERWGIQVTDVNIVNFQFSADFDAAIEKKVKAEQEALAEKNKLESVKFQAQQKIEQSKAEAESIRIQAEAIKSQ